MDDDIPDPSLKHLLDWMTDTIALERPLPPTLLMAIKQNYSYINEVLALLPKLTESEVYDGDELSPFVLGCFHFIEICLLELRTDLDQGSSHASEQFQQLCTSLSSLMAQAPVSHIWIPVVNLFVEVGLPLSESIKSQYYHLLETQHQPSRSVDTQQAMQHLLGDDTEHNAFDIAEIFFAQTNIMPERYYLNFVKELLTYGPDKAIAVGTLFLMHPDPTVRAVLLPAVDSLFDEVELPAICLTWLVTMRQWLPSVERIYVDALLVKQRRHNPVFAASQPLSVVEICATEMDSVGSQAVFVLLKHRRGLYQTSGLLVKRDQGIIDVWISSLMNRTDARQYVTDSLEGDFDFCKVDLHYLNLLINDHLFQGQQAGRSPHVNLLWLQGALGVQWTPVALNPAQQVQRLMVELTKPFDNTVMKSAFRRSRQWPQQHIFTSAWFDESQELDRCVNQHCSFVDGIKHCDVDTIVAESLSTYFEHQRERWLVHFLWLAMWSKPHARRNSRLWQDAAIIAQAIYQGVPLSEIPMIVWIAEQSIRQSLETMEVRKTHLS